MLMEFIEDMSKYPKESKHRLIRIMYLSYLIREVIPYVWRNVNTQHCTCGIGGNVIALFHSKESKSCHYERWKLLSVHVQSGAPK